MKWKFCVEEAVVNYCNDFKEAGFKFYCRSMNFTIQKDLIWVSHENVFCGRIIIS